VFSTWLGVSSFDTKKIGDKLILLIKLQDLDIIDCFLLVLFYKVEKVLRYKEAVMVLAEKAVRRNV
jgi:hypothetical protein